MLRAASRGMPASPCPIVPWGEDSDADELVVDSWETGLVEYPRRREDSEESVNRVRREVDVLFFTCAFAIEEEMPAVFAMLLAGQIAAATHFGVVDCVVHRNPRPLRRHRRMPAIAVLSIV